MSIVEDFIYKLCPDFMKLVIYPTYPREFSQDLSGTLKVVFISFFYSDCLWSHASLHSDVFPQTGLFTHHDTCLFPSSIFNGT